MYSFSADSPNLQYLEQVSFFGQEQVDLEGGYDHLLMAGSPPLLSSNRPSAPYDARDLQFLGTHQQQSRPGGGHAEPTTLPPAASSIFTSTSLPAAAPPDISIPLERNRRGEDRPKIQTPVLPQPVPESAPASSSLRKRLLRKDRHSKIVTAKGPRDRRMRLSLDVAKRFFHLQDELGFDKPSKTVDWLLTMSKDAIAATAGDYDDIYGGDPQAAAARSSSSDSEIDSVTTDNDTTNSRHDKGKAIMGDEAAAVLQASLRAVNIASETADATGGGGSAPHHQTTRRTRAPPTTSNAITPRGLARRTASDPVAAKESREKARARARDRTMEKKLRKQCMQPPAGDNYKIYTVADGIDVHELNSSLEMAAAQMQGSQYYRNVIPSTAPPVASQAVVDGSGFLQYHSSSGFAEIINPTAYSTGGQVLGSIFQDQTNFLLSSSLTTAAFGAQSGIAAHAHFLDNPWDGLNNP